MVAENKRLPEIIDLLKENIRLKATLNIYQHTYGDLTDGDLRAYLEKDKQSDPECKKMGRSGPI